jgi:hypothetical protein
MPSQEPETRFIFSALNSDSQRIPGNHRRFLSDTRPPHAFYAPDTPATIVEWAVSSHSEALCWVALFGST